MQCDILPQIYRGKIQTVLETSEEDLDSLMRQIDDKYVYFNMGKNTQPGKSTSSSKWSRLEESPSPQKTQFESNAWDLTADVFFFLRYYFTC